MFMLRLCHVKYSRRIWLNDGYIRGKPGGEEIMRLQILSLHVNGSYLKRLPAHVFGSVVSAWKIILWVLHFVNQDGNAIGKMSLATFSFLR